MPTPYIGFGNDQIKDAPSASAGDTILCPHCLQEHQLQDGIPPMILFFTCGEKTYVAGFNGKLTMGIRPSAKGEIE